MLAKLIEALKVMALKLHGIYVRFWNEGDANDGKIGAHVEMRDDVTKEISVHALHTVDFSADDKRRVQDVFADHVEQFLSAHSKINFDLEQAKSKIDAYEERFGALETTIKETTDVLIAAATNAPPADNG